MNLPSLEQAYYIAELAGLILVVISLVYVGKQLSQSNRAQRISAIQVHKGAYLQNLWSLAEHSDAFVSGLASYTDLDPPRKVEFAMAIQALIRHLELSYLMVKEGVLSERTYLLVLANANNVLSYPGAKDWWETRRAYFDPEFVESLTGYMRDHKPVDQYQIRQA